MIQPETNIVLIGMAGSGKSSIGRLLAGKMNRIFIDTDELIEKEAGIPLQEIINSRGLETFQVLEEKVLAGLTVTGHVIATGGSAVYSRTGILHLKKNSVVIFLDVGYQLLLKRINNFDSRGLVKHPHQTFSGLYNERLPLYRQYADYTLSCGTKTKPEICREIIKLLQNANMKG